MTPSLFRVSAPGDELLKDFYRSGVPRHRQGSRAVSTDTASRGGYPLDITWHHSRLVMVVGDITREKTDAIVNAANSRLAGGGGVDGAIHRAGGPAILEACRRIGGCPAGKAVITTAGWLQAKRVIHTVGPVYRDGSYGEADLLRSCYVQSLLIAVANGMKSVAFPAISTGVYGYPLREAARVALLAVMDTVKEQPDIETIRFVLFDERTYRVFNEELKALL